MSLLDQFSDVMAVTMFVLDWVWKLAVFFALVEIARRIPGKPRRKR